MEDCTIVIHHSLHVSTHSSDPVDLCVLSLSLITKLYLNFKRDPSNINYLSLSMTEFFSYSNTNSLKTTSMPKLTTFIPILQF